MHETYVSLSFLELYFLYIAWEPHGNWKLGMEDSLLRHEFKLIQLSYDASIQHKMYLLLSADIVET